MTAGQEPVCRRAAFLPSGTDFRDNAALREYLELQMAQPGTRPRILVLTSTFPRWQGDTEPRFVLDLCRHLSDSADLLVLAPDTPGAAMTEVLEGVEVRRFRYFLRARQGVAYAGGITARLRANPLRVLQLPFFFISLWWVTRRLVREWKPDVIHAHWIIPQGLVACFAAGRNLPVLCTSHGGDLHNLRAWVFRWLKAWTLGRCRRITVVSTSMVPQVTQIAPGVPVDVIPMGTDLETQFVPPPDASSRRAHEELIFVGRLVEKKGLRYLLEAVALLSERRPSLTLTVVGDGPLKEQLLTRADQLGVGERIRFVGGIPHRELPGLYQRAALAVFPFVVARDGDQEGFGLVVVEAMGCGCPVIVSDVPAIHENVVPGVTGLLVPQKDPEALAAAIDKSLAGRRLRTALAAAALERVRARFDWSPVAESYHLVIRACIEADDAAIGSSVSSGS